MKLSAGDDAAKRHTARVRRGDPAAGVTQSDRAPTSIEILPADRTIGTQAGIFVASPDLSRVHPRLHQPRVDEIGEEDRVRPRRPFKIGV